MFEIIQPLQHYLRAHTALNDTEAGDIVLGARSGDPFLLPEANTIEGGVIREILAQAIEAARATASAPPVAAGAPAPASAPAPAATAPALSDEERAVAIRAIAGPEVPAATVNALISSGSSFSEAAVVIASIKATTAPQSKPRIPTVAERAAELPEMGPSPIAGLPRREAAKAGWDRAFMQAEQARKDRHVGR